MHFKNFIIVIIIHPDAKHQSCVPFQIIPNRCYLSHYTTLQVISVSITGIITSLSQHYRYYYFTVMALQVLLFLHPSNNYCLGTTGIITSLSRHYRYYYFTVTALQVLLLLRPSNTGIITVSALQILLLLCPGTTGIITFPSQQYRYYYCLGTTGIITALSRHYRYYYFSVLALQVISVGTTGIITSVSLQLVFGQLCSMAVRPGPQTPPIYNGFAEMTVL